ncbi:MAG: hypothetical protein DRO15_07335, partial [Thermoprotei archaeon]
ASPLVWLILSAFDPKATSAFKVPKELTFKNFGELLVPVGAIPPLTWIINSIIISVSTATLVTILSVLGGYTLSRYKFRGQGAMLTTFVILRLVPTIVIALPIVTIFASIGWLNTLHAVILVLTALILPFALLIADGYFKALPIEYEEAAMIDGCSRLGAFMRVTLPLALPGIVTIWLIAFVTAWGEFLVPFVILPTAVDQYPASVGIYYWFGVYGRIEYGRISAFSLVYSIPVIITFLSVQKYLRKGIAGLVMR